MAMRAKKLVDSQHVVNTQHINDTTSVANAKRTSRRNSMVKDAAKSKRNSDSEGQSASEAPAGPKRRASMDTTFNILEANIVVRPERYGLNIACYLVSCMLPEMVSASCRTECTVYAKIMCTGIAKCQVDDGWI